MPQAEFRDCPRCGTPVTRELSWWRALRGPSRGAHIATVNFYPPGGRTWFEYITGGTGTYLLHDRVLCDYKARNGISRPSIGPA